MQYWLFSNSILGKLLSPTQKSLGFHRNHGFLNCLVQKRGFWKSPIRAVAKQSILYFLFKKCHKQFANA